MKNLLITKGSKNYCSIVNTIFRRFMVNGYIIVLLNREVVIKIVF
jgi:hypothetical protein